MSLRPIITVRADSAIKKKLRIIARKHTRSLSQEAEWIIKEYVHRFEKQYGEIKVDED
ncbi:hypothetical protein [Anaerospora hongkongensis]|uniref:hypothetical protein n=1 Tax=Anaerospora hongkongensis TaxID=244830 RepID=UPI002FDA631F